MTISAPSDPLVIIHSLASISPSSLSSSARITWLLDTFSSTTDHDMGSNTNTATPTVDATNFFRTRVWIQKDCTETEYFVPFNSQGEFVMFADEEQQSNCDEDQHRFDLLVPRYKYRVCIINVNQSHTTWIQEKSIVQPGSLLNAYCYLDCAWKLCTVHDIIGVIDESGDIHVLSSRPYSYKTESIGNPTSAISPFEGCKSTIQRVVGERDAAMLVLLCLISTP